MRPGLADIITSALLLAWLLWLGQALWLWMQH